MKRFPNPFVSGAAILLAATVASAATFRVDDASDVVDLTPGDGVCATAGSVCTLRAAVQEANALPGEDRIRVPEGTYDLSIAGAFEDAAATGDLDVTGRLRIVGAGPDVTIVDANALDRVLDVQPGARVTLVRVAVRGGKASNTETGGGIHTGTNSRLVLKRGLVESNEALVGGGIGGTGRVKITSSTVRDNLAEAGGGLLTTTDATIRASTFDGNVANGIGALFGHDVAAEGPALVTIVNSTITGQIQTSSTCRSEPSQSTSGADFVLSNVTVNDVSNVVLALDFCTPDEGTFTLRNTIVQQCHATLTSQGYNFVQPEGCVILGDLTGVVVGDDPLLGSLKDNGGPTFTRLPVAVSLAVDGGNPATPGSGGFACEPFDQRGVARLLGLFCDIGAVEEW